jgi:hypothetical protein
MREETFAPILYVLGYDEFKDAIKIQNDVPQGLFSCIFTLNMREAEPATGNWDQPTRPNWDTVVRLTLVEYMRACASEPKILNLASY